MTNILTKLSTSRSETVLISIHPKYVDKILSGEKTVEFRRTWAKHGAGKLLIYTTAPVSRIVAIADISNTIEAPARKLWNICKPFGTGIAKADLLKYFSGKKTGTAIRISTVSEFKNAIDPKKLFGTNFKPPQSFRYLDTKSLSKVNRYKALKKW